MTIRTATFWFVAPLLAIYTAAVVIAGLLRTLEEPGAVAVGLTVDLVIVVPTLYYVLFVRGRGWPAVTTAPVFLLSFGAASLIVPADYHDVLDVIGYALPLIEVALLGYVGYKAMAAVRAGRAAAHGDADVYERLRQAMHAALPAAAAGVLAYEIALFYYAFSTSPGRRGWTYHRRSGYGAVLAAMLIAAAFELVAVHLLLQLWSAAAAWVHFGLSTYAIVWLVGDFRAMKRRPHEMDDVGLHVRCGLRWEVVVRWDNLTSARPRRPGDDYLNATPIGSPNVVLDVKVPLIAMGPYGMTREVRSVGLFVDERAAFLEQVQQRRANA